MPYLRITNRDISNDTAFYYALLSGYNRKVTEVSVWLDPVFIINSPGRGIYSESNGDFTFFRKHKVTGKVEYRNCYINCRLSSSVVFVTFQQTADVGYNFKVEVSITETGGSSIANFEYGITQDQTAEITNWQTSSVFDLSTEGIYYFDVRLTGQDETVGRQALELLLTSTSVTTGGDVSDKPVTGTSSSED